MQIIGDDKISVNGQLYGSVSVDDAATINADDTLTPEQRNAALMDPEGYKFHKANPHILNDAKNYPAIFANLSEPSKYAITRAYQNEMQKYEDEIKVQQRTQGPFEAAVNGFAYSWRDMRVSNLQAKIRDAIHEGDTEKAKEYERELKEEEAELSYLEAPNRAYWGASGAVGASLVREMPFIVATGVATAALTAAAPTTGGASLAGAAATAGKFASSIARVKNALAVYRASRAGMAIAKAAPIVRNIANAAYIYNDTANIEGGAAYAEMKQKHPDWSEQDIYSKSVAVGRIIGAIESSTAFLGTAALGGKAATSAAKKVFLKNAVTKSVENFAMSAAEKELAKKALIASVESGILKPAMTANKTFVGKLVDGIIKLARSRTGQAVEFGTDIAMEGATEVYQNKISDIVMSMPQGEEVDYTNVLGEGASALSNDVVEIYNHMANGTELSDSAKETLDTFVGVMIGSALVGGGYKGIDLISSRALRNEARSLGTQLDAANKTINTFDAILKQKQDGTLYNKSPETANAFYTNAVKGGELPQEVYVSIESLNKILDEMKNDPVAMAKINSLKIPEKIASGEDVDLVSIPTEDFVATVVDPNNDTLYQRIKGSMTTNPALESKEGAVEMVKKIATEDSLFAQQVADNNSIYNMVLRSQRAKGASEKQAKFNATIMQFLINTLYRAQSGMSYEDIVNAVKLRIENVDTIQEGADALYQAGYVSMRNPLEGGELSADLHYGEGEGGTMAHGWGNYVLADLKTNKKNYYDRFNQKRPVVEYDGEIVDYYVKKYDQYYNPKANFLMEYEAARNGQHGTTKEIVLQEKIEDAKFFISEAKSTLERIDSVLADTKKEREITKEELAEVKKRKDAAEDTVKRMTEFLEFVKTFDETKLKTTEAGGTAELYSVDVPESEYLLDEESLLFNQSKYIRDAVNKAIDLLPDSKFDKKLKEALKYRLSNLSGKNVYASLRNYLGSKKEASKALEKGGVKGIRYWGGKDKRGYVIFNGKDVPIVNRLYQFAGRSAKTASIAHLSQAVILEQQNTPMADIFKQTGWFKDPRDGQWKFEISDKDAVINEGLLKKMFANKVGNQKLIDVMKHDKLYAAYPEFADVEVIYNSHLRNTSGQTYIKNGQLKIEVKKTDDFSDLKLTILHELAHRIQDKEGFGRGGRPGTYSTPLPSHLVDAWIERQKLQRELLAKLRESGVQPSEGASAHVKTQDARPYLNKIAEKDENVQKQLKRLDELDSALKRVDEGNRYMKYYNLPGENEARDVEARSNLTDEQRRNVLPANLAGVRSPVVRFTVGDQTIETPVNIEPVEQIAGAIQFGVETIIQLAKIENPTTFAHEGAHLFGRFLFGAYNAGTLNEHWIKNAEQLADFLGIEKDDGGAYQFAGNTAAEEKFAEAFASYLKTGKSPASYLKDLFDLAFEWFANVYRALRMSEVKLSRKVTKVFDEIFVPYEKQQEIMEERRFGFIPRPENMTPEQYENYKTEKRAAAIRGTTEEVKRAAQLQEVMSNDVYKAEREAAYNSAIEQLEQMPVYQMIDDVIKFKINKGSLAKISSDIVLPSNYLSTKQGVDITQVLAEYGNVAQTEDQLAQILAETPSKEDAANYAADKHMSEWLADKYPELAEINAETAARNERVFKLATMEYMMLSGIGMERFNQIHNDLLATAEFMVQNMPLRKMSNTQRWVEQESKLMQRYDYTTNQKDRANIKRQQAILNYYAMRSKQISVEAKRFNRKSKKYRGPQTKEILKRIDGDTFDLLKSMLGNFKLTTAKPNTDLPMGMRIDAWVNLMAKEEYTSAGEIERYREALIAGVDDTIKTKDFEFLKDAFGFVESVGLRRKEVIVNGVAQTVEDAAQKILDEYIKHGTKPIDKELGSAVMREAVMATLWPKESFLTFTAPVFKGITRRDLQIAKWKQQVSDIIKPMYKQMQNKVTIDGRVYTNENLLVMMLNSGNTHNINCMVKTLQFQFNDLEFTTDDLFSALNQAPKELREMTRRIWKIFDDNKQQFQDAQRQIDGKVLKFVDPEPYEFADGEQMPGGYYPAGKVSVIHNYENSSTKFQNEGSYPTKSFQIGRTHEHGDLDLTLNTLNAWFYKMSGVVHLAVPYNNMTKLLRNETFRRTVGEGMVKSLNQWLNLAVAPEKVNQTLAAINQIASVSILGMRLTSIGTQLSAILPAMNEIGPYWIMHGLSQVNPIKAIHQASKLSEYMYARYAHPEEHLHLYMTAKNTLGNQVVNVGKDGVEKLSKGFMTFIIYSDAIASTVTWQAEFAKQKAAGMTDAQASDLADSKVRMLQGDASAGSRAPIIQGNLRFFTMFASYFIGIHSLVKAHGMRGDEKAKAIGLILAAAVAAPMFEAIFNTAWKAATADDDDKKKMEREGIENIFDLYLDQAIKNIASTAGAIWLPHFGLGGDLGTALATGRTYAPENIQVKYMLKPIEFGASLWNAALLYSQGEDAKANKKVKKSLQNLFEFSMLNPNVAKKVTNIIMGD